MWFPISGKRWLDFTKFRYCVGGKTWIRSSIWLHWTQVLIKDHKGFLQKQNMCQPHHLFMVGLFSSFNPQLHILSSCSKVKPTVIILPLTGTKQKLPLRLMNLLIYVFASGCAAILLSVTLWQWKLYSIAIFFEMSIGKDMSPDTLGFLVLPQVWGDWPDTHLLCL